MGLLLFAILVFNIFLWIVYADRNSVMSLKQFRNWWFFLSLIVALLAMVFEPKTFIDWDLIRLFKHIENIRSMGLDNALALTEYRSLYVIKYWMYLVSKTNINGLFQAVPLCIDFLIFGYIIKDIYKKRREYIDFRTVILVIYIWISLMGLKLAISDVRCTWAMGFCCLAFYKEYICEERKIKYYLLYLSAIFIHHFTILFLIFRGLLILKRLIRHRWIILIGALLSQFIIYGGATLIYSSVSNDYIKTMARKLLAYWELYGFSHYFFNREVSMKVLYLSFIMVFVFGYIWSTKLRKHHVLTSDIEYDSELYKANDALFVLSCLGIGFFFNYLLLERLLYIAAYVFSMYVCINKLDKVTSLQEVYILPFLSYILFFNDINIFIVNFLGYYYL